MIRAEGMLTYPPQAEGFGRRLTDVFQVRWVVPEVTTPAPAAADQPITIRLGAWCFPSGIYQLSIVPQHGPCDERRVLLGDRRRRHREVDRDSIAFEERGSGDRREKSDTPWWR